MSFFSWLAKKPTVVKAPAVPGNPQPSAAFLAATTPRSLVTAPSDSAQTAMAPPSVERKVRRHARREQLYVAIRESMTRAGLLSASYRFKVLSLDQHGNQFLVMMDIAAELTTSAAKLSHTEEILVQTAKAGYDITVTAVYWRVDTIPVAKPIVAAVADVAVEPESKSEPQPVSVHAPAPAPALAPAPEIEIALPRLHADPFAITQANTRWVPEQSRHDPLLEAEVAAFKRALAAAPALAKPKAASAAAIIAPAAGSVIKARATAVTSYALITGFEDTEVPDASAMPALSATQYGELN